MGQFVIGLASAKLRQRSKGCIAIDFDISSVKVFGFQSIDKLPDYAVRLVSDNSMFLARFLFWTISNVFMQIGDYSPCVGT